MLPSGHAHQIDATAQGRHGEHTDGLAEWCADWFNRYTSAMATDPKGPAYGTGRVVRGGSYGNWCDRLRTESRNSSSPDFKKCTLVSALRTTEMTITYQ